MPRLRYLLPSLLLAPLLAAAAPRGYLAVVIDDLGQNAAADARVLALPAPVNLAIMPDTPYATTLAQQAHAAGRTYILHLPMDPAGGPYAWHPDLPTEQLLARLDKALAKLPGVMGVNNHEGSRMTAQRGAMAALVAELQARGLFLLDSRTTAATTAAAEAQKIGLASASRDVFLDNVRTPEAIRQQLSSAVELALRQGSAVAIGHPYGVTLDVLAAELPRLKAQGIELIELGPLIALRGNRAMAAHGKDGVYR